MLSLVFTEISSAVLKLELAGYVTLFLGLEVSVGHHGPRVTWLPVEAAVVSTGPRAVPHSNVLSSLIMRVWN